MIFISSNLLKLSIKKRDKIIDFEISEIIDSLIKIIKNNGTIIVPTFNWNFCKGLGFHYKNIIKLRFFGKPCFIRPIL